MIVDNSLEIIIGVVGVLPFIIFFIHRHVAYKHLQKILKVENRILSKEAVFVSLIWLVVFSIYLLAIDSIPFELGKFYMLSYIFFPVIVMLFGGSLYHKTLISVFLTLSYSLCTFLSMYLLGKIGYYEQFLRSGDPTSPYIIGLFISFAIIVSIIFLITAIANTIVKKITR